ncbi:hypothetical protein AMC82_PD00544 (plasmid) [Rhizobium phaseoli]|nr:hypothetical protein AMC84_PD00544 [Rhizobium phaseoli]ANL82301.1 hypothetical protein AMC82_PD00544 [Rhizobium phaseoli]
MDGPPRHLEGRLFSVVVYGATEGAEDVRRNLSGWLRSMDLIPAGPLAEVDRYIGYWPYATSHVNYEKDQAVQEEIRNAARTLYEAATAMRQGRQIAAGAGLRQPRQKCAANDFCRQGLRCGRTTEHLLSVL